MNDFQKRFLLFIGLCVPSRFILMYIAKILPTKYLRYMGFLLLGPVIGWSHSYFTWSTKSLGAFGGPVWWNKMRPIHAGFYFIFSLLAINKNKNAYLVLLLDTLIGIIAFIKYYLNIYGKLY